MRTLKKALAILTVLMLLLQSALVICVYAAGPPDLEQHIFVHYAKGAKPKPPATDTGYYKLLGAKWQTLPVTIEVNPTDPTDSNLDSNLVLKAIGLAAGEWDDGAYSQFDGDDSTTWGGVIKNIFDDTITTTTKGYDALAWSSDKLDEENTIVFGDYPTDNVIAVTIIWYNRATKEIIEFDMVLDTDFTWGNAAEDASVMDLQNIVTHELGHGIGLNDLYLTAAFRETMYGYADKGETIKRSLYKGDMAGVTKLYGP